MFDDMKLSDAQSRAACHEGGNLLLVAGPGSGKTHTMTARILYLTERMKVDPARILVITFTRDAAASMKNRYLGSCGMVSPVVFGTFHSVFYHMILDHMKPEVPRLIFDRNRQSIARKCIRHFLTGADSEETGKLSAGFLSSVSLYKNTLDLDKTLQTTPRSIVPDFQDMFSYYEAIRRKNRLMDFDDMVYDFGQLLRNDPSFVRKWKGRFDHILIDEFQDINPVQFDNIKGICTEDTKVFAVGDDDQSIYGFRGSDPRCIRSFIRDMRSDVYHLDTNYRSGEGIVRSSGLVIRDNVNRIHKDLRSGRDDIEGELYIKGFEDRTGEYDEIIRRISDESFTRAVLFRTNPGMQGFASYLSSRNIPYRISENFTSIFDHFIVADIFAYLRVSLGIGTHEDLRRIVNAPDRSIDREMILGCKGDLDTLIEMIRSDPFAEARFIKVKKLELLKKDLDFMKDMSPCLAVRYLLGKIGYEKYLKRRAGSDTRKRDEFEQILEKCLEIASLAEDYDELTALKEGYEKDIRRAGNRELKNAVDLMTIHASKGLEFDRVFIPDCNEGNIPHGKMLYGDAAEEERRVFYVGMTRAVDELHLYYISGRENTKYVPSRFLNPLRSGRSGDQPLNSAVSMEKRTDEE